MNKKLIIIIVVIAVIFTAGYFYYKGDYSKKEDYDMEMAYVPEQIDDEIAAPDFELENLDGERVKLSDYRGKIVFLNFWATWCKYCRVEMPDFNETNKEFENEGDAIILTVNVKEEKEKVENYINKNNISLPVLLDTEGKVAAQYGVNSYPSTFIINPDGNVYNLIHGMTDGKTLKMVVNKIKKQ